MANSDKLNFSETGELNILGGMIGKFNGAEKEQCKLRGNVNFIKENCRFSSEAVQRGY